MNQAIEHSKHLGFADKIRFIGFHQNGPEPMADFDCLLMTSDDKGLPITGLEALAQGIPVVSTDVGGISESSSLPRFYKANQEAALLIECSLLDSRVLSNEDNKLRMCFCYATLYSKKVGERIGAIEDT